MSMWQYMAAIDGYIEAHGGEKADRLTRDDEDELWEWLEAGMPDADGEFDPQAVGAGNLSQAEEDWLWEMVDKCDDLI